MKLIKLMIFTQIVIYSFINISCSYIAEVKDIDDISSRKLFKVKVLELKTRSGKHIKFESPDWGFVYENQVIGNGIDKKGLRSLFKISLAEIIYLKVKESSFIGSFISGILVAGGVFIALFYGLLLLDQSGH